MLNDFEKITRIIYRKWKAAGHVIGKDHPNAETLACFLEDKLASVDKDQMQKHLLSCDLCAEYLATQLKIEAHLSKDFHQLPAPPANAGQ